MNNENLGGQDNNINPQLSQNNASQVQNTNQGMAEPGVGNGAPVNMQPIQPQQQQSNIEVLSQPQMQQPAQNVDGTTNQVGMQQVAQPINNVGVNQPQMQQPTPNSFENPIKPQPSGPVFQRNNDSYKKPNKKMIFIIIGGVVVLLIIILAIIGGKNKDNPSNEVNQTPTNNTSTTTNNNTNNSNTNNNNNNNNKSDQKIVKYNEYGEFLPNILVRINKTEATSSLGHEGKNKNRLLIYASVKNNTNSDIVIYPGSGDGYEFGAEDNKSIFSYGSNSYSLSLNLYYVPVGADLKNVNKNDIKSVYVNATKPLTISISEQVKLKPGEEMEAQLTANFTDMTTSWGVDYQPYVMYFTPTETYFVMQ